jgi:ABC-type polar amino acid transport system ATPase subunit
VLEVDVSIVVTDLVRKHPGSKSATLKGLSLDVKSGQLVAVVGKSGAGKSTLLRVLSGLDPFDGGTITVDGIVVRAQDSHDGGRALRGRVGFVFQSLELFPHLSVLENCTLAPIQALKQSRDVVEARARSLLQQLDVDELADRHPEQLSGGQKQRVAIARALALEPRVLLYDEPTSALDPALKAEVARTLLRVQEQTGMTQVVVTHDMQLARDVASCAFVLESGTIARFGPPAEVLA